MSEQDPVPSSDISAPIVWVETKDQTPAEAAEVARMTATVNLAFPAIGFIDPEAELAKMRSIVSLMPEAEKIKYPGKIRAAILAHEAKPSEHPEVTDEELALAIFIRRTYDTPLTEEELEAKATGKKKRDPAKAKTPKTAAEKGKATLDDLFGSKP